jgi:SAM-dependent methyltransferase
LLRVTGDDPEYRRLAAAEAAYWQAIHPLGLEAAENILVDGQVERYVNHRFTGDPRTDWTTTIARWGVFDRGLMLGISSPRRETTVLATNPSLHLTLMDMSSGAVERHARMLAERFEERITTATADLNFVELPEERYDVIVSSSTIHHVTNLEHLAFQINRALAPGGYFFLEDYVGEPRFAFSDGKRRLFEILYDRDIARQRGRKPGVTWLDGSDLSPFCGVRSDEILDVFRRCLDEVQLRTAATLTAAMSRMRPADWEEIWARVPRWRIARILLLQRLGIRRRHWRINEEFFDELCVLGDAAAEAGLLRPGIAFAVYRKRPPSDGTLGADERAIAAMPTSEMPPA